MSTLPVTLEDVEYAAARIGDAVVHTPCLRSETLSRIAKADVWVKFENQQFTASFKERGALNTLLQLAPEEKKRGVIAMSAGNHAQGVAYHAGRLGIPATIVMPSFTPNVIAEHTRSHGATVILPVYHPGGLLFLGDGHALQGDGEVNLTALECSDKEIRIQPIVRKDMKVEWPFIETKTHWITTGFHEDLNVAMVNAIPPAASNWFTSPDPFG